VNGHPLERIRRIIYHSAIIRPPRTSAVGWHTPFDWKIPTKRRIEMKRFVMFFVLGLAAIPQDGAAAVEPTNPSEIVTLRGSGAGGGVGGCAGSETNFDTQVMPDGTTQPFTIRSGEVLILTGVEWFAASLGTGRSVVQEVVLRTGAGPEAVYRSHSVSSSTGPGYAGQQSLIPRVVVKPGVSLCNAQFIDNVATLPGPATLHGFLTKDKWSRVALSEQRPDVRLRGERDEPPRIIDG
jgi:hypothetical protein